MPQTRATTVILPETLYAQIENVALEQHRTVDEVSAEAVGRYIKDLQWKRLKAYGHEKAQKLGIRPDDIQGLIAETRGQNGR